ncbi:MAG TPA: 6-phospho-3-hexuloisomerase [Methanocorpusculum sp.]|nr:6-phospho-3-hexuloisomerase [Methanocorpusculum sp.]HJJ33709.1 6-phospho-3-hexuloisomerase [Methanocorpusculum sp.]HJJ45239.1 6-phospho-3-hexuloisomerase [Methanocorpusculum sp.]HJJ60292.1 6-phospho-3-hexuloisomerase [Methanocorpusculum sp.]
MNPEGRSVSNMMRIMANRIDSIASAINQDEIAAFIGGILEAKRIYVIGAGRSGLVAKSFAMRLMHTGFTSYVVGETITPAVAAGDLLIAFSGSGNTKYVADIAETAKSIGVKIALVSSNKDSRVGKIVDYFIRIETQRDPIQQDTHEYEIRQMLGAYRSFAPLGTIFETTSLIFSDAVISTIMELRKIDESELKMRHTNIE